MQRGVPLAPDVVATRGLTRHCGIVDGTRRRLTASMHDQSTGALSGSASSAAI